MSKTSKKKSQQLVGLPVENLMVSVPGEEGRSSPKPARQRVPSTDDLREKHDPYGFREGFRNANINELVAAFNREVGCRGWVRARGEFLFALHEAFLDSGLDCSSIIDEDGGAMSLADHIRVEGDRVVTVGDVKKRSSE